MTRVTEYDSANPDCMACNGCGWVCENHSDFPWSGLADVIPCCGGAGAPCHCNPLSGYDTTPDLARLKKRGLWIAIPLFALCVGMGFWAAN